MNNLIGKAIAPTFNTPLEVLLSGPVKFKGQITDRAKT